MREMQLTVNNVSIKLLMKQNRIKMKDLSKHLKLNPSTITRMLKDEKSLSLYNITDILSHLGYKLELNVTKK